MSPLVIRVVLDRGREKRVDEGSLAKSRLSRNLTFDQHSASSSSVRDWLTIIVNAAPRLATILWRYNVPISNGETRKGPASLTWFGRLAIPIGLATSAMLKIS